jgi:glycerol-3-phosphate O-acyltransferase
MRPRVPVPQAVARATRSLTRPLSLRARPIALSPHRQAEKSKHNRNVMKEMGRMFKDGGKCIWVAPSGGRDRKDSNGEYEVAKFDAKSVEMFRLMGDKGGRPTHFYPLSMLTYNVCPPPETVGGAVGEQRTVRFSPAGLYFGDEVNLDDWAAGCLVDNFPEGCEEGSPEVRDKLREEFAQHMHSLVSQNYKALTEEMAPWLKPK